MILNIWRWLWGANFVPPEAFVGNSVSSEAFVGNSVLPEAFVGNSVLPEAFVGSFPSVFNVRGLWTTLPF